MSRTTYNTSARKALLTFLKENRDRQYSSKELAEHFAFSGASGKSTIYRQLSELCADGIVRRYTGENKTPLYQYFSEGGCSDHFHMKCMSCGKLFHLECHEMSLLEEHITRTHNFSIDRKSTVLLGVCSECNDGGHQ